MIYFRGLSLDFAGFFSYLEAVIYWSSQPRCVRVIKTPHTVFPNLALTLQVKSRGGHTHTYTTHTHTHYSRVVGLINRSETLYKFLATREEVKTKIKYRERRGKNR